MIFVYIICFGGIVGFAMGWGFLSKKAGCSLLFAVLILIIVALVLEPMITGERQRSTATVAVPLGGIGVGLGAAAGAIFGMLAHWLACRKW